MIVADANLIVYFAVDAEQSQMARRVWEADPDWRSARLWRSEFLNALLKYVRAGYLTRESATAAFGAAEKVMAGNEYEPDATEVLDLAMNSQCSAYDCEYVALALRLGVPLVTADRRILREFPEIAVSPDAFTQSAG